MPLNTTADPTTDLDLAAQLAAHTLHTHAQLAAQGWSEAALDDAASRCDHPDDWRSYLLMTWGSPLREPNTSALAQEVHGAVRLTPWSACEIVTRPCAAAATYRTLRDNASDALHDTRTCAADTRRCCEVAPAPAPPTPPAPKPKRTSGSYDPKVAITHAEHADIRAFQDQITAYSNQHGIALEEYTRLPRAAYDRLLKVAPSWRVEGSVVAVRSGSRPDQAHLVMVRGGIASRCGCEHYRYRLSHCAGARCAHFGAAERCDRWWAAAARYLSGGASVAAVAARWSGLLHQHGADAAGLRAAHRAWVAGAGARPVITEKYIRDAAV